MIETSTKTPEQHLVDASATAQAATGKLRLPIVIVGAGGIVRDAHLPAYRKAGFPVVAITDTDAEKAAHLAANFQIPFLAESITHAAALAPPDAIYDIAVPAAALLSVLEEIPAGSSVLLQKPMGESLQEARSILALCRRKRLTAAVNFQLRYAPVMSAARTLAEAQFLGQIHDMEVQVSVHTPWELWSFLRSAPRLEILYHSIHYVDLIRAWFGDPAGVYAKTVRSPQTVELAATKTVMVFDYGDWKRVYLATNHSHDFGPRNQRSFVQWEGTQGAARATMGVNLDYPKGQPDSLTFAERAGEWRQLPTQGDWFPDAFIGSMGSLQAYASGASNHLPNSVENAIGTMRVVEAAYLSSERGGISMQLPELTN